MTEQLTDTVPVPHPDILEVAELYADGHQKLAKRMVDSDDAYAKVAEFTLEVEATEAVLQKRSVLGRLVGRRALNNLRNQQQTASDIHANKYLSAAKGYNTNKNESEQHFKKYQEEYYDNAIELARADGVDVKVS